MAQVMAGGVFGAAARAACDQALPTAKGSFPATTLVVNLAGAFLLGLLLEALVRGGDDTSGRRRVRRVVGTGFIGAYTTYSTFALEADLLVRAGRPSTAALYVAVTVVGGLIATTAGISLGATGSRRRVNQLPVDPDIEP